MKAVAKAAVKVPVIPGVEALVGQTPYLPMNLIPTLMKKEIFWGPWWSGLNGLGKAFEKLSIPTAITSQIKQLLKINK